MSWFWGIRERFPRFPRHWTNGHVTWLIYWLAYSSRFLYAFSRSRGRCVSLCMFQLDASDILWCMVDGWLRCQLNDLVGFIVALVAVKVNIHYLISESWVWEYRKTNLSSISGLRTRWPAQIPHLRMATVPVTGCIFQRRPSLCIRD